jgi:hypothetical protein
MAQPPINLHPYGLNWTLDPKNPDLIPPFYEMASVIDTPTRLTFKFSGWSSPRVFEISNRSGNTGTFGKMLSTTTLIDTVPLIIKYMDNTDGSLNHSNIIRPVLILNCRFLMLRGIIIFLLTSKI